MSDLGTFCLYVATFTLSAYLFHLAMKQKKEGKNPVFRASDIGVTGTDYWND